MANNMKSKLICTDNNIVENKCKQGSSKHKVKYIPLMNAPKLQYADIHHKQNNGSNNWAKFKETEKVGMSPIKNLKNKQTENSNKKIKVTNTSNNNCNKFKELQITPETQPNVEKKPKFTEQRKSYNDSGIKNYNKVHENNSLNPKLTKCIAIDCEMVGVDEDGKTNMLARISFVNSYGDCIYDKFVKPIEPVTDYRTKVSGVRPEDLEDGDDFDKVQKEVAIILKGRILVGHALKNDLAVLFLNHPRGGMRDTSRYKKFQEGFKGTPSLKKLAAKYLNINIQEGEHSSVEDAKAAMMLYMMFRRDWEAELRRKKKKRL